MEKTEGNEKNERGLSVRESVEYLREKLGTYSNYLFAKDITGIEEDTTLPESTRGQAQAYKANPRLGVNKDLLEAIIARRLPEAPQGFIAQDQLRTRSGGSWEEFKEVIKAFIRIKGYNAETLTNIATWRKEQDQLAHLFVHARSGGNGYTSIFFSPEAQKEIIRMIEEKRRSVHEPKPQAAPPKARIPLQEPKTERPRTHEQGIIDLKRRIAVILPDLLSHEQRRAEEINRLLSPNTNPRDAEYLGQEIRKLETAARRNRQDE